MAGSTTNPVEQGRPTFDLTAYEQQPELALVSLLNMMTAFPARRSAAVAESVLGHLCLIADDERYAEPLRQCAVHLIETWDRLADLSQPACCGKYAVH